MSLKALINLLVEETLVEMNAISTGGAALLTPDAVQGFQSGFGAGEEGEEGIGGLADGGESDSDIEDENFDQVGQRDKHRKQLFKFMWSGEDPKNKPPKVRYVAV